MLCCFVFLLAATFWVLKSLNKRYESVRISYPVSFIYDPDTFIPVTAPPKEIIINVDGKGWKLLRKTLNLRIKPARIHLVSIKGQATYLTAQQLRPYISSALNGLKLNYIVTDTIYFNFERRISRRLKLALDTSKIDMSVGYMLAGPVKITPAAITVTGPSSLVKALQEPYPLHLPDSGITQPYRKQIPLAFLPNNLLQSNVEEVNVVFGVRQLAKSETPVPVQFQNLNLVKGNVKVQPQEVQLTYYFLPADTPVNVAEFKAEADFARLNTKDSTIKVQLTQKPAAVKTVSVSPQKVKVVY